MKKTLLLTTFLLVLLFWDGPQEYRGDELSPNLILSNGKSSSALTDDSHYTSVTFDTNDTITITSKNNEPIIGLYISWDSKPVEWTLSTDAGEIICGKNGFLHEYVALPSASNTLTIRIPEASTRVDQIRIFGAGELPHDVQVWDPPCDLADVMVVSSHADDEILFLGGILPTYTYLYDAEVQVVYMCEFWTTKRVREHEKLDGLWESGIRHYPVCGNFKDLYSKDLATAKTQYDYDAMVSFLVSEIRRCKPQVVVTHDINGEYGHGYHMLTSNAVLEAVNSAPDATKYPHSASANGTWNTPKTYLHIYFTNSIKLDLHIPIEEDYAGRTALEISTAAYKKHVSQQYCWFYVSDSYEYSCADFGLIRSTVGCDTTNDLLCNLKTYSVMEKEEQERIEAEKKAQEEAERKEQEEQEKAEEEKRQEVEKQKAQEIQQALLLEQLEAEQKENASGKTLIYCLFGSTLVCFALFVFFFIKSLRLRRK